MMMPPSGKTRRKAMAPIKAWAILALLKSEESLSFGVVDVDEAEVIRSPKVAVGLEVVSLGEVADRIGTLGVAGDAYCVWARTKVAVGDIS